MKIGPVLAIAALGAPASAQLDLSDFTVQVLPDPYLGGAAELLRVSPDLAVLGALVGDWPSGKAALWRDGAWSAPLAPSVAGGVVLTAGISVDAQTVVYQEVSSQGRWSYFDRNGIRTKLLDPFGRDVRANNLSEDGSTITGSLYDGAMLTPFVARDGVLVPIGEPSSRFTNGFTSWATRDGSLVVGESEWLDRTAPNGRLGSRVWLWSQTDGFTLIPEIENPPTNQIMGSISGDGRFVVGTSHDRNAINTFRAWMWEVGGELIEIEAPAGMNLAPTDVSLDGGVVIGRMGDLWPWNDRSFIWTRDTGVISAYDLLAPFLPGVDPHNPWNSEIQLTFMNDDATHFAGTYVGEDDVPHVFVMTVPAPATTLPVGVACFAMRRRRG